MRRHALLFIAFAVALGAVDATPAARAIDDCVQAGAAITATGHARVYRSGSGVYACSLENGRRTFLGSTFGSAQVRPIAVAGRLVAWYRSSTSELQIANVLSGRLLLRRRYPKSARVRELVLTRTGAAAWIEESPRRVGTLHRRDWRGTKVLASARDLRDLALRGRSLLYWTAHGRARSAALEPYEQQPLPDGRRTCGRAGDTIFANAWVRVWEESYAYYACSLETRAPIFLGEEDASSSGTQRAHMLALAGSFVVTARASCGPLGVNPPPNIVWCGPNFLQLVDVRARRRHTLADFHSDEYVTSAVLKPNGSAAWIEWDSEGPPDERVVRATVRRRDRRGHAVISSGVGSDTPTHLARAGSTLYWTQSGAPRSASLR